jgi:CubicO group peptidase (beta-lactamase class C family)
MAFPDMISMDPFPTVIDVLDGKKTIAVTDLLCAVHFEPGSKFQYSGGGTTISQVILTDVTKQAYDTWMYDNMY